MGGGEPGVLVLTLGHGILDDDCPGRPRAPEAGSCSSPPGHYHGVMPAELPYIASKVALRELPPTLAAHLIPPGVTVSRINPGPNNTGYADDTAWAWLAERNPGGRASPPQDTVRLNRRRQPTAGSGPPGWPGRGSGRALHRGAGAATRCWRKGSGCPGVALPSRGWIACARPRGTQQG